MTKLWWGGRRSGLAFHNLPRTWMMALWVGDDWGAGLRQSNWFEVTS